MEIALLSRKRRPRAPAHIVGGLRSEITKLATEFRRITVAGPNRDDARSQINSLVQSLAARGRPRIDVQHGEVRVSGHSVTAQFLAWLDPDRMIAALPSLRRSIAAACDHKTLARSNKHKLLAAAT